PATLQAASRSAIAVAEGFDPGAPSVSLGADDNGVHHVRASPTGRVVIRLGSPDDEHVVFTGFLLDGASPGPLPAAPRLHERTGAFSWAPGLACGGTHRLLFVKTNTVTQQEEQIRVDVTIDVR